MRRVFLSFGLILLAFSCFKGQTNARTEKMGWGDPPGFCTIIPNYSQTYVNALNGDHWNCVNVAAVPTNRGTWTKNGSAGGGGVTAPVSAANGGLGSDVSASNGVPLFASGVPTFTAATGIGNFMRASATEVPLTFSTGLNRSTNTISISLGTTNCTNQFISAISAAGAGTCTSVTLAGPQFANQGTASTVLHGNGSGNPSFGPVVLGVDISGAGTGVLSALGVDVGSSGSVVVNGGALGTPSSGTLINATGLPISTGLSGAGTGVLAALVVNVGSAGAPIVLNGAGGTPSSITLTNGTGLPTTGLTGTLQAAQEPAHTGDVTNSGGSLALAIAANAVTLAKLATQVTNTVIGNATSGAAVPTALPVGTCSTAGSALIWTTNTGFGCNTSITAASVSGFTAGAGTLTGPASSGVSETLGNNETITGIKTFSPTLRSSGIASYLTINMPADTGQTTATESIGVNFQTATRTWADGTVALQRERFFAGPTYNKTTTSATFTDVFNAYFTPPIAGSGVTFTRGHTLGIVDPTSAASSIAGGFVVATTLGTPGTSVGIGGGKVNAGAGFISTAANAFIGANFTLITDSGGGFVVKNEIQSAMTNISAGKFYVLDGSSNLTMSLNQAAGEYDTVSGGAYAIASSATQSNATPDTFLRRDSAGVFGSGTAANNNSGSFKALAYLTNTNCTDSAGAAACGSATAGSFVIDAAATTVVVSTTSVTANSQIFVQFDSSLGARLSITCNSTVALPAVTARTAATNFTVTVPVAPITNPACYSYHIVN